MAKFLPLCVMLFAASISVSAQTYTVVHNFGSQRGDPTEPVEPGTIAQSRGGAMVTTTRNSGSGKAFRVWPDGTLQVLHKFPFENDIESIPHSPIA